MQQSKTKNLVGTGLCLAMGVILPQLFHMVGAGTVFLPMHIPVLICGLCFGWQYGLVCGLITPLVSSVLTGMPPLFPTGTAMMFELGAYGAVSGLLYRSLRKNLYLSLVLSMLAGRAVSGIANTVFFGIAGKAYGFQAFLTASFVTGLPGIILQLVFVPLIVYALEKSRVVQFPRSLKTD
ncbi:MAG: ECF transporter S component [Eubacteriaceae bacterium]